MPSRISQLATLTGTVAATVAVTVALVAGGTVNAAPASAADLGLDWGVKASFRAYVTGSIAHGTISTGGGASTNGDGSFHFPRSSGSATNGKASAAFGGSVTFTGHDYGSGPLLELRISSLKVALDGGSGALTATLRTRALAEADEDQKPGPRVTYSNIKLATLSGAQPSLASGTAAWSSLAATLTAAGAPAFGGFYSAGQALDPVTVRLADATLPEKTGADGAGSVSNGSAGSSGSGSAASGPSGSAASGSGSTGSGSTGSGSTGSASGANSGSTPASTPTATGSAAPRTASDDALPGWAVDADQNAGDQNSGDAAQLAAAAVPVVAHEPARGGGASWVWTLILLVALTLAVGAGSARLSLRRSGRDR